MHSASDRYKYDIILVTNMYSSSYRHMLYICTGMLVSGKVRHAQGQRLNRFEVKEREKVREQKGRGKCPPSFLCF